MRLRSVTVLLCAIGAVIGALAGIIFLIAQGGFTGGPGALAFFMLFVAALVGATVGAIMGPPIALGLLRHVPLWRAALDTGIGASLGSRSGPDIRKASASDGLGIAYRGARWDSLWPRRRTDQPNGQLLLSAAPSSLVG